MWFPFLERLLAPLFEFAPFAFVHKFLDQFRAKFHVIVFAYSLRYRRSARGRSGGSDGSW